MLGICCIHASVNCAVGCSSFYVLKRLAAPALCSLRTDMTLYLLPACLLLHSLDTQARAYGDNLAENPRYAQKGAHYYDACGPTYKVAKVRHYQRGLGLDHPGGACTVLLGAHAQCWGCV